MGQLDAFFALRTYPLLRTTALAASFAVLGGTASAGWEQLTNSPGQAKVMLVKDDALYVFASNSSFVAAVFVSTDGGATFSEVAPVGFSNSFTSATADGNTLYAGNNIGRIYRSTDNGANWTQLNNLVPPVLGQDLLPINTLHASGNTLYAGTDGAGLRISTDGGATWAYGNAGMGNKNVQQIEVVGTTLFVATLSGVYGSADGGQTWTEKNNGLPANMIYGNGIIHSNGKLLFSCYQSGVFQSNDMGGSWTPITAGVNSTNVGWFHRHGGIIYLAGAAGTIHYSSNDGASWTFIGGASPSPFSQAPVVKIAVLGSDIYAGTTYLGVWKRSLSDAGISTGIIGHAGDEGDAGISVFPNPTAGPVTIGNVHPGAVITVIDPSGKVVHRVPASGTQRTADLSALPAGTYHLHIVDRSGRWTVKPVVRW